MFRCECVCVCESVSAISTAQALIVCGVCVVTYSFTCISILLLQQELFLCRTEYIWWDTLERRVFLRVGLALWQVGLCSFSVLF